MRYRAFLVTLSPRGDLDKLPEELIKYFSDPGWEKVMAVAEKADKWHIHIVCKHAREMRSDNLRRAIAGNIPEYGKEGTAWDTPRHALDIAPCVTANENGIAAGYMAKTDDFKLLMRKGFTEEDMAEGVEEYERGKRAAIASVARKALKACTKEVYESLYWIMAGGLYRKAQLEGKRSVTREEIHFAMVDAGYCFIPHIKEGKNKEAVQQYVANKYGKRILENAGLEEKTPVSAATMLPDLGLEL